MELTHTHTHTGWFDEHCWTPEVDPYLLAPSKKIIIVQYRWLFLSSLMNLSSLAHALFNMRVNILSFAIDHFLNTATSLIGILSIHIDQVLSTIVLLIIDIDCFWTSQPPPSRYIDHLWMSCFHWWKYIDLHGEYFHDNLHQSKCWSPVDRRGEHVQHVSTHPGGAKIKRELIVFESAFISSHNFDENYSNYLRLYGAYFARPMDIYDHMLIDIDSLASTKEISRWTSGMNMRYQHNVEK